mgnify:CR=1 FL=1
MALAVCTVNWWVFTFVPGAGRYFKYMCAGVIAGVGVRCGVRWSLGVVIGLNTFIGLILGPRELLNCLFLVTPMGLLLPTHPRVDQLGTGAYPNKLHMSQSLVRWWGKTLLIYGLSFVVQIWLRAALMHVKVAEVAKSVMLASYHVHARSWEAMGICVDDFVAAATEWIWAGLSVVGMGYGLFFYLVNRPICHGYLLLQKRVDLD